MERKNADIRRAAASAGVKLWQIAEGLGVNDGNFSLRLSCPQMKRKRFFKSSTISKSRSKPMNNTITLPTMISVKQASAQFGLTPYFLRSLCHDGKIRYIKVSKNRWLLNAESIADYCNGIPAGYPQPDTVQCVRRVTL